VNVGDLVGGGPVIFDPGRAVLNNVSYLYGRIKAIYAGQ
jgi:hypothetical protein